MIGLLASLSLAACAPLPFDLEAWKATKLAELQPHPLEVETPIAARSINAGDLGPTLEQRVAFLAPELRDRIVGSRAGGNAFSRSIFIVLDEMPSRIAPGVCRSLGHAFRSSLLPSESGTRLEFRERNSRVGFFAADDAGRCPYDPDRTTFWTNKDEKAVGFLAIARAAQARLAANRLRVTCDESIPECETLARSRFDVSRITYAGPCDFEPNCTDFRFPSAGAQAPYGLVVAVYGGQEPRRITAFASSAPPPE